MINDLNTKSKWKIQLSIEINFLFSKDTIKMRTVHTKSDNIEILIDDESFSKISKLLKRKKVIGSEFVFNSLDLLHYKCHKISIN